MPRFDYECTECGQVIEIEHSIKDDAVEHQPHPAAAPLSRMQCNGKLKRLVGRPMFNFKGGAPTPKFHS